MSFQTARRVLGDEVRSFRETVQDSLAALPEEGEVTVVPEMDGVRFNPPSVGGGAAADRRL